MIAAGVFLVSCAKDKVPTLQDEIDSLARQDTTNTVQVDRKAKIAYAEDSLKGHYVLTEGDNLWDLAEKFVSSYTLVPIDSFNDVHKRQIWKTFSVLWDAAQFHGTQNDNGILITGNNNPINPDEVKPRYELDLDILRKSVYN